MGKIIFRGNDGSEFPITRFTKMVVSRGNEKRADVAIHCNLSVDDVRKLAEFFSKPENEFGIVALKTE